MLLPFTDPVKVGDFPVVFDYEESWSLLLLLKRDGRPTFDYSCARFAKPAHTGSKRRKINASEKETPLRVDTGDLEDVAHDLKSDCTENILRQRQWSVDDVVAVFRSVAKRTGPCSRY